MEPLSDGKGSIFFARRGRNTGGPGEIQAVRKKYRRRGRNAGVPTKYGRLAQIRQLLLFKEVVGRYPSPTSV